MACLVKTTNDGIYVSQNRVHAPGYTLLVSELNSGSTLPDGWKYYTEDLTLEDFPPKWNQPRGAHDAYENRFQVFHNGKIWESIIKSNVWEPGVSGWIEITGTGDVQVPAWIQPTGSHDAYQKDASVSHASKLWNSTLDSNVWEPGVYGWTQRIVTLPDQPPTIPVWVQPTGAGDAYAINAIVSHNGHTWKNTTYAANVWEPGIFGWVQLT